MADLSIPWGGDLTIGPNGDFASVTGSAETQQRIIRRLLTNPIALDQNSTVTAQCDYAFHPNYGAGARRYVHSVITDEVVATLKQRVTDQALQEPNVTSNPGPTVNVAKTVDNVGLAIDAAIPILQGQIVVIPTIQVTP